MARDAVGTSRQVLGNYELLAKVGEGGLGTVYKARHRQTGQIVAVKTLPAALANNPIVQKRLQQEFRAARLLDHPNIVRALDYDDTGTVQFLVMEFVEGESLGERLDRRGRIPEEEAIRLIAQVCAGLHEAHQHGLIHRDVKPDNILVSPQGQAKLIDLGLVKETETNLELTRTGGGLGTPHFMAPEQFRGAKNADVRCDIYSLGATLYNMVTGELPFSSSSGPLDAWMKKIKNDLPPPRQRVPSLSARTDQAILRAMSADREARPASCPEFLEDLLGTGNSQKATRVVSRLARRTGAHGALPRAQTEPPQPTAAPEAKEAPALLDTRPLADPPDFSGPADAPDPRPAANPSFERLQWLGALLTALAVALIASRFLFHG
jgi:serine/threonine protein kinase